MKSRRLLGWVLAALLLAGCDSVAADAPGEVVSFGPAGVYSGRLVVGGDYRLRAGEQDPAAVLLLDGSLEIEPDARLGGPLLILGGRAVIDGRVDADVTMLNGVLRLGPDSHLQGRLRLGGGSLQADPGAVVASGIERGSSMQLPAAPPPAPGAGIARAVLLALLAYLTVRSSPRAAARVGQALTGYPVITAAMGLLSGITGLTLLVLMAFTIVLIPVSVLLALVGVMAVVFGWIGLGLEAGQAVARWLGWRLPPQACAALGTLLTGLALEAFRWLPILDWVPGMLVTVMSLGAVLLTRFGLLTFIPAAELDD